MRILMVLIWMCAVEIGAKNYKNYQLLLVTPRTPQQLVRLKYMLKDNSQVDIWIEPSYVNHNVEFIVSPSYAAKLKFKLEKFGFEFRVLNKNIQDAIDEENAHLRGGHYSGIWSKSVTDKYATYKEIIDLLEYYQSNYNHTSLELVGKSWENRDIMAIKFSVGPSKKKILVECGTHCREWITIASCLKVIKWMATKYRSDADITNILELYEWIFVPLVNPDGYNYTHESDRMWRKNRKPVTQRCIGTDLNRNYDANWRGDDGCDYTWSPLYRGPSPFSEPETLSLSRFIKKEKPYAFFSVHSYSQYVMTPFSSTDQKPKDSEELTRLAMQAAAEMKRVNGFHFIAGRAIEFYGVTRGSALDWAKMKRNIKYSFAFELRPKNGTVNGFILPKSNIKPSALELFAGLKTFAKGFL